MTATSAAPSGVAERKRIQPPVWLERAIFALLVLAGTVITWFRVPSDHRDRVWAEDANIFLAEAIEHGPWAVLFNGYAGYQHLVPRVVVGALLPGLDLAAYPVVVFAICSLLTGLTAGAVYFLTRDIVPWQPARITLALITVLIPLATQETIGNLADIHTYAMWIAPWLLLYRPRNWWASAGWGVLAWVVVMTEIQAVFFFFLIFFRLRRTDRLSWPILGGFVLGSVIQIATAVTVERNTGNGPLSIPSTVMGWLINTVMPLVTADPVTIRAWIVDHGLLVAFAILVPLVIAAVIVLIWGDGDQRVLTIALLLGSAAIYTGSAWANSGDWFMYAEIGLDNIESLIVNIRYGVASGMMLVATVPMAAAVAVRRWPRRMPVPVLAWTACVGLLVVLAYGSTQTISLRNWVDPWSGAVEEAEEDCASLDPTVSVTLPVAPDRSVDLTCEDVLTYSR